MVFVFVVVVFFRLVVVVFFYVVVVLFQRSNFNRASLSFSKPFFFFCEEEDQIFLESKAKKKDLRRNMLREYFRV